MALQYEPEANPEETKRVRIRARILDEIATTEETYQLHLSFVVKFFEEPLRQTGLVPLHVVSTLFSNISQLLLVNRELSQHLVTKGVGQAFLTLGPFLKLYSTYANNHERALATLIEWEQKNEDFASWRRSQEEMPEMCGLKLNALLITPVQRIPRYKLLLEDLLQHSEKDTEEYTNIAECVRQVSEVASHINEHIKQQDNFMRMAAIQRSLVGSAAPRIITPGRIFVREGVLYKVHRKGGWSRERKFYLFSDMLMYAKARFLENTSQAAYSCCCIMPLHHCIVTRLFGNRHGDGSLFTIQCKEECILLYSDQQTVDTWIEALNKAISAVRTSRKSLRKPSSAKTPLRKPGLIKLRKEQQHSEDPLEHWGKPSPQRPQSPRSLKRTLLESKMNCLSPRSSSVKDAQARGNIRDRRERKSQSPSSPKMKLQKLEDENADPSQKGNKQDGKNSSHGFIVRKLRHLSGRRKKKKTGDQTAGQHGAWMAHLEKWESQSKDLDDIPQPEVHHGKKGPSSKRTAAAQSWNLLKESCEENNSNHISNDLWITAPKEVGQFKSASVTSRVISKRVFQYENDTPGPDVPSDQAYGSNRSMATFSQLQTSAPSVMPPYPVKRLSSKSSYDKEIDPEHIASASSMPDAGSCEAGRNDGSDYDIPKEIGPYRSPTVRAHVVSKTVFTTDASSPDTFMRQFTEYHNPPDATTRNTPAVFTTFQTSTPLEIPAIEIKSTCNFEEELSPVQPPESRAQDPSSGINNNEHCENNPHPADHSIRADVAPQALQFVADNEDRGHSSDEEETQPYGLSDCDSDDLWSETEDEEDDDEEEGIDNGEECRWDFSRVWKCPDEDDLDPDPGTPSHVAPLHDMTLPPTPPPLDLDSTNHWSRPLSAIPEAAESPDMVFFDHPKPRAPLRTTPLRSVVNTMGKMSGVTRDVMLSPTTAEISQRACMIQ